MSIRIRRIRALDSLRIMHMRRLITPSPPLAGAYPEETFTGSNPKASEASQKFLGVWRNPRKHFCDNALQVGLKRYFRDIFFDHALKVYTLNVAKL